MLVEFPLALSWGFLSVFARVAGIFTFLPLPGLKTPIDAPRIVLSVLLTLALFPRWPTPKAGELVWSALVFLALREAVLGVTVGLIVSFALEIFQLAAQMLAQQAGFSYASTIDPTNDTDSGVLLVLCQLLAGWFAILAGLDRQLFSLLLRSLEAIPPGSFLAGPAHLESIGRLGARMFEMGLLLSLPSVAIFAVLDVLLAVISRLEQQLQLTSILFPAKTACAILAAAIALRSFPGVFETMLSLVIGELHRAGF